MTRDLVDVAGHIAALRREGDRLAAAADSAGPAPVPSCPDWDTADLVAHVGMVHRWAAHVVAGALTEDPGPPDDALNPPPQWAARLGWYRDGHHRLITTLEAAPTDLACLTFLDAPSPLTFWARRQAHETAVHRIDAELAGGEVTPVDPGFATDGIDELLAGFFSGRRSRRLRSDPPRSLAVVAADTGLELTLGVGPEGTTLTRHLAGADCTVTGDAPDLYLLLWNRGGAERIDVSGDRTVLDWWRDSVTIRWS